MFVYRDFERRKRRTEQYSTNSGSGPPFVHDLSLMIGLPHSPLVHTADLDGEESGPDAWHSCCTVSTLLVVVQVYLKRKVLVLSNTIACA